MIAAAEDNGVKLTIGLVCRYHGTHSVVRDIVQSGELGAPACMMVHRIGGPWRSGYSHTPWRLERAEVWWDPHGDQRPRNRLYALDLWGCHRCLCCRWTIRTGWERLSRCRARFLAVCERSHRLAPLQSCLRCWRLWWPRRL